MNLKNLTVAWITRKSDKEIFWLKEYLEKFKNYDFNKIVVGYSNLDEKEYKYKYIPFWENGIDEQGLICHKKNLVISNTETENIILLHADCCLTSDSIKYLQTIEFDQETAYGMIGYIENTNKKGFTWLDKKVRGEDFVNLPLEEMIKTRDTSFICGSAIAGKKNIFIKVPWNESLKHNQNEDGDLSQRLREAKINLLCLPNLVIEMKNDR